MEVDDLPADLIARPFARAVHARQAALYGPDKSSRRAFWLLGRVIPACLLRELDSVHRRGKSDSKREGRNPRKHRRVR
jgi:hypothetical protein